MMSKLSKWHKTKLGLLVFGLVELGLTYGFASLAIDRGSLWYYLLTLIFLVGTLQNIFKLIGKVIYGIHKTSKA
jgi:hypothetical protein